MDFAAPAHVRTPFLGLTFDLYGPEGAARAIVGQARKLEGFVYVATPNVDHIVRLDKKPELKPLYADAWLNLSDSRILEIFAEISQVRVPAAPGSDIVELLFREHIKPHDRITIVGGDKDDVDALRTRYGLGSVAWLDAPAGLKDNADARAQCAAFIRDNPAPFVFLAVGSPQQEMIAHEVMKAGGATGVAICCGASLEFLSGKVQRAPEWMRASRLEWLHRLVSQPGRLWRRYLVDGPRIFGIWRRWEATR